MEILELTHRQTDIYKRFREVLGLAGAEVVHIDWTKLAGTPEEKVKAAVRAVESADALWLPDAHLLDQIPQFDAAIERAVERGARALVTAQEPPIKFIQRRGVERLSLKVVSDGPWAPDLRPHPRLIELTEEHPYAFMDPRLFKGVSRLVLQQPDPLTVRGAAASRILTIPLPPFSLVDGRSDTFVRLPKPELPVAALVAPDDWKGEALVFGAGLLHDPYGTEWQAWPGIEAGDNGVFAKNVANWLISGEGSSRRDAGWLEVYRLISEIEYFIAEITEAKLGPEWYSLAPASIHQKCEARAADEKKGLHPAAYFDLTDYEKLWSQAWESKFLQFCRERGLGESKKKGLSFFGSLNELRKPTMHATKRRVAGLSEPPAEKVEYVHDLRARLAPSSILKIVQQGRK